MGKGVHWGYMGSWCDEVKTVLKYVDEGNTVGIGATDLRS